MKRIRVVIGRARFAWGLCLVISMLSPAVMAQPPEDTVSDPETATDTTEPGADEQEGPVIPFSLQPYQVHVSVSTTGAGREYRRDVVLQEIRQALHRMYGQMWRLDLQAADWLRPGTINQIAGLEVTDLIDERDAENPLIRYSEADTHKAMLLGIAATTAGFNLVCREYDVRTQELSPALQAFTPDAKGIAPVAARLVRDSFRPYLKFVQRFTDDGGAQMMRLQVQAGEIVAPDPSAEQIQEGDVLRPFQRFMFRADPGKLKSLRALPLTYIRLTSVDQSVTRGLATGAVLTHGAVTPFGMRGRSLEQVALRQRPAATSSKVRLVQRSLEMNPLVCQRVSVAFKLHIRDSDTQEQLRLVSDRNGELTIPLQEDHPTVWIYVYSGRLLLARVPYAPGILPLDTITLPDDSIRLSVEGDLQLFRDELVDAVALREVYFSMANRAAEEGESDAVKQHLESYDAIPKVDAFRKSLALIRVGALAEARRQKNRHAQRSVEKLCRKMEETLDLFFSEEKRLARQDDLQDLRRRAGI